MSQTAPSVPKKRRQSRSRLQRMMVLIVRLSTGGNGVGRLLIDGGPVDSGGGPDLFAGEAEPALPALVLLDGGDEFGLGEIGPQNRGEDHLRVGTLHEKEIAEPRFPRSSDQQVGIRQAGGVEIPAQHAPRALFRLFPSG